MSTVQQAVNANPTTPVYTNDLEWVTAYFTIHMLSVQSRRYIYIFWFCIAFAFIAFSLLHLCGASGGTLGAYWKKWAIRRRTWRGQAFLRSKHRKGSAGYPISLPPNGQLLALTLLPIATFILAFAGPDFISPANGLFDVTNPGVSARAYDVSMFTRYQPQYTINKAWWTLGGRTGLLAFAMFPLCVVFALKSPPFAIFALPFTTQIHFDKLSWLHRWTGRLIYLITLLHIIFWSVQLFDDRRPRNDKIAYTYVWQYDKFIYGWVAFILMTLLMALSLPIIRRKHYETFYSLHVLLVPLTLIVSSLHHPPVWIWCWAALALWGAERMWRGTWWLYINGMFGRDASSSPAHIKPPTHKPIPSVEMALRPAQDEEPGGYPPQSPFLSNAFSHSHASKLMEPTSALKYSPPSGYAHAELLSGATIRLTFISPRHFSWAPGQHFLINIPSVSRVLTHPFTAASIYDEQAPSDSGRALVFLVRSKGGWTRDLWDYVLQLVSKGENHSPGEKPPNGTVMPKHGVLLRMFIEGPFGSSVRAHWESHSTVVILVAGSGVSFGLSILEYVCLCLAGRDGRHLGGRAGGWGMKGFATRRVRFVWLIREFAHIQWCASIIRRCQEMIPSPGLDVDIFVTNAKPAIRAPPANPRYSARNEESLTADEHLCLTPPAPNFVAHSRAKSSSSTASDYSSDSDQEDVDLGYYAGEYGDEMGVTGATHGATREDYTLDLTNFDGDNDYSLPGEAQLNERVQRVGKDRRAHSRRFSKALAIKQGLDGFGRALSRMSGKSTDRLVGNSKSGKPSQSRPISMMSEEGDETTLAYAQDDATVRAPPSASHTPPIPSLPRQGLSRPPTPGLLTIPPTPSLSRPPSLSPSGHETLVSPSGFSTTSFGEDAVYLEDGNLIQSLHLPSSEMRDITYVAERARPGKPNLESILREEVDGAIGSVVVACCGPTSFSAMVRKTVAFQIDPARVRKGDRRGNIALVSEEFEY